MSRMTRPGKTVAAGVTLAAAVGVALVATLLMRGGGTGSGAGTGTGPADGAGPGTSAVAPTGSARTQPAQPENATPQRPMKIVVRGSSYFVDGREVKLEQIGELAAKVPEGEGIPVLIEHEPTSRAKAEEDLEAALTERGINFAAEK
ncbi:MAG: hypothetical protein AVDCRST_MAG64-1522 [uncultured Phycisphaerae bacterium]|uniref:Uncharacterized protein n=1 Tax=uncultured Phycisphaerae bacterium TaxID=904963 RepID=A0A6J4NSK2_9BACT|nr:MAG: hypothetical protein AVDCRST_MAG64-1522 [uncultured Phycisphaerae bacterium]